MLVACLNQHMQAQHILSIGEMFIKKADQPTTDLENDLIKRCRDKDPKAMEQIVQRYQKQVYNTAYGIIGNREDAQDITQDVFLTIWNKIGQFRKQSKFSTWIYQIAKNQSLNLKNKKKRRKTDTAEIDDVLGGAFGRAVRRVAVSASILVFEPVFQVGETVVAPHEDTGWID